MNKLAAIFEKMRIERKYLKTFLLFLFGITVAIFFLVSTQALFVIAPIILVTLFTLFFSVLWFTAGYAVFRSLMVASVGLSFIVFIAQSYCELSEIYRTANDSLVTLLSFGFIYVGAQFLRSLYKELFGDIEAKEVWRQKGMIYLFKEINQQTHSWLILVTYGAIISLFIWQIYSVVKPIIKALCVFE